MVIFDDDFEDDSDGDGGDSGDGGDGGDGGGDDDDDDDDDERHATNRMRAEDGRSRLESWNLIPSPGGRKRDKFPAVKMPEAATDGIADTMFFFQ